MGDWCVLYFSRHLDMSGIGGCWCGYRLSGTFPAPVQLDFLMLGIFPAAVNIDLVPDITPASDLDLIADISAALALKSCVVCSFFVLTW